MAEERPGAAREIVREPLPHRRTVEGDGRRPRLVAQIAAHPLVVAGEPVEEQAEVGEHPVGIAVVPVDPDESARPGGERLRLGVHEVDSELVGQPQELAVPRVDVLPVMLRGLAAVEEVPKRPTPAAQSLPCLEHRGGDAVLR